MEETKGRYPFNVDLENEEFELGVVVEASGSRHASSADEQKRKHEEHQPQNISRNHQIDYEGKEYEKHTYLHSATAIPANVINFSIAFADP